MVGKIRSKLFPESPEMPLGPWIRCSLQQTYIRVWSYLKLKSWALFIFKQEPASDHLHCSLHSKVNPLHCRNHLKRKFLNFLTLYMSNGTRQHINPHYKTKLVVLIQSFLYQQMETFNNPPFRTSPVDTDYYMLRQDHTQAEHVRAV